MFSNVAEKIVSNMEKQHMIQAERRSIYQYGINQMLSMLLNIITILALGLIFHMSAEAIVFTCAYIPVRIYAGGFHARTPFRCWILSALMLLAVLIFIKYVDISVYIYDMPAFIGAVLILIFSPVEDKNKPLDEKEKTVYKRRCIFALAFELLVVVLLRFFQINSVSACIEMAWTTLSIMLITGKIKNFIIDRKEL
ncbi:MAG: accessory gene regulator ArgB-like protein [Porcipelethomonas sp.]